MSPQFDREIHDSSMIGTSTLQQWKNDVIKDFNAGEIIGGELLINKLLQNDWSNYNRKSFVYNRNSGNFYVEMYAFFFYLE